MKLVLFASIQRAVQRQQLPGRGAYERIFPDLNFQVRHIGREWRDWTAMLQRFAVWDNGYVRKARLNHLYFDGFIALKVHIWDRLSMVTIY